MGYNLEIKAPPSFYTRVSWSDLEAQNVRQILVVSDLHLSEGYSPKDLHWNRRENFTADTAFARFLQTKREAACRKNFRVWLIINGDFIDFLRIMVTPETADDLQKWQQTLKRLTREKLPQQERRVLKAFDEFAGQWRAEVLNTQQPRWKWPRDIRDERKYGLKTHDFKSIYRLMIAKQGHLKVFQALAKWLADGHRLTIITGNHDQEFNQELVQAGFLWMLEKLNNQEQRQTEWHQFANPALAHSLRFEKSGASGHDENGNYDFAWSAPGHEQRFDGASAEFLPASGFAGLPRFEKHGLEITGQIRVEHGHRFEWTTSTDEQRLDPRRHPHQEIFLAPGSLFNRYLLNRVELEIPYLDNVKPATRALSFLLKHRPRRFLNMLGKLIETAIRLAHKRGARRLVWAGVLRLAQYLIPSPYVSWVLWTLLGSGNGKWQKILHGPQLLETSIPFYVAVPVLAGLFIVIAKILKAMNLGFSEKKARAKMSRQFGSPNPAEAHYAIYGHTHKADMQRWDGNIIYINSGAWTPVFEYESGHVRDDLTRTFVELNTNAGIWKAKLLRWEALTNRETEVILIN